MLMRLIHWPDALDIIAEPIAMTAGKETATSVQFGDPPTAIHTVGAGIADEPRSLTAEAARCPSDRHALFNRLPLLAIRPETIPQCDLVPAIINVDPCAGSVIVCPLPTRAAPA